MPAKGRVTITVQTVFALIPFCDLFASYRIKKMRWYLLAVWIPIIAIGNIIPHLMGYSERPFLNWENCEPNWFLFFVVDTCEPFDLQVFSVILTIGVIFVAVFLIRWWSKQWNKQFEP